MSGSSLATILTPCSLWIPQGAVGRARARREVGDVLALLDTGAYQEVSILKEAAH